MPTTRSERSFTAFLTLLILGLGVAACSPSRILGGKSSTATTIQPTSTTLPVVTTTTEQPGWTPVSSASDGIAVDELTVNNVDGSQVTVARFRTGRTFFALHVGSQDPPTSGGVSPDAGPAVSSVELPTLLAAFNGGFKISDTLGGFEVDGRTLSALVPGLASFVIDRDGSGHVGVWGQNVPAPGEQIASVRQNLQPLVSGAHLSVRISDISMWGPTLGGGAVVARSALGEDARGDILYAGSMSALPIDMGSALITAGAISAMELDINPEWVQLALAPSPGGPLAAGVPGQHRPADQYLVGWTRDFVAVMSTP